MFSYSSIVQKFTTVVRFPIEPALWHGLEILPTEHLGTAASQMEKRNIKTERGDVNRYVRLINKMIQFYNDEIARLKEEANL